MGFPGFSTKAVEWLKALPENNNREWFQANKAIYESEVKEAMASLVTSLNEKLVERCPEYFQDQPVKAIFRIYRDTRFSKDKTPYKTHAGAVFPRRGLGEKASGLYFQVAAAGVGVAGGAYMPPNDSLLAIRTKIAADHAFFLKLVNDKKLTKAMGTLQGDALARPPKGFPADHPAIDLLKKKQFYFWKELPAALIAAKKLETEILNCFESMRPVMLFLDDAVIAMRKKSARSAEFLR
ncbi:MAG: DUF2461 domain-containing protein [Bryobacterales bacterium]|nr:DUF2461 domain-containing protein [Bryobacterales bacterium]